MGCCAVLRVVAVAAMFIAHALLVDRLRPCPASRGGKRKSRAPVFQPDPAGWSRDSMRITLYCAITFCTTLAGPCISANVLTLVFASQ